MTPNKQGTSSWYLVATDEAQNLHSTMLKLEAITVPVVRDEYCSWINHGCNIDTFESTNCADEPGDHPTSHGQTAMSSFDGILFLMPRDYLALSACVG
jgi:hypothetical protein